MQEKRGNILAPQTLAREKTFRQLLHSFPDEFRHILGQNNVEAGIAQIESHRGERIGKQKTLGRQNARPGRFASGDDHARRAVAEQHRRNQIGLGKILALKRERGKFDRNQQRRAIRKCGQIFPGAREARGARGAAEFRDGKPAHIRAKSHDRGDMGVERRNHHARARNRDRASPRRWAPFRLVPARARPPASQVRRTFPDTPH